MRILKQIVWGTQNGIKILVHKVIDQNMENFV